MTRTITAAEVIPGQRIRWTERGTTRELNVAAVRPAGCSDPAVQFRNDAGCYEYTNPAVVVTVLAEPPVIQPEPRRFGVCAVGTGYRAVRASGNRERPWTAHVFSTDELVTVTWAWLCERGPVTVLPETGWAVPTAPVAAPERIEVGEWPTDDRHLWDYEWIDSLEWIWTRDGTGDRPWTARPSWDRTGKSDTQATTPIDGPWMRGKRA